MNRDIAFNWTFRRRAEMVKKVLSAGFYAFDGDLPNVIDDNSPAGINLKVLLSILVPAFDNPQRQESATYKDSPGSPSEDKKSGALLRQSAPLRF